METNQVERTRVSYRNAVAMRCFGPEGIDIALAIIELSRPFIEGCLEDIADFAELAKTQPSALCIEFSDDAPTCFCHDDELEDIIETVECSGDGWEYTAEEQIGTAPEYGIRSRRIVGSHGVYWECRYKHDDGYAFAETAALDVDALNLLMAELAKSDGAL